MVRFESVDFVADPLVGDRLHRVLASARTVPGGAWGSLVGQRALVVTGFDELRTFLADDEQFPGGPVYEFQIEPVVGRTFISADGAEHHRLRQLTMPAFRSRAITGFVDDELVPLAHEIVDRFVARGEADLVTELTEVLPYRSISRKVGLPVESEGRQRALARTMLTYPVTPDAAVAAAAEVGALVAPVIEQRRREPTDDVVSGLLGAERDGDRLSDEQVSSHVQLMYAVGATTTADAMSSMLRLVLTHPEVAERVRAEPAHASRVVHECLRYDSPVAVLPRLVARGGTVGGVELPAGSLVLAALAGANRDPAVFADPDRFDPDRDESDILTFGFGTKHCPGAHLGRRQLAAALTVVLERLPGLRLVEATEPSGGILRSVSTLRVSWDARAATRV